MKLYHVMCRSAGMITRELLFWGGRALIP